jgi:hypothetical protein
MRPVDHSELGVHPAAIADLQHHVEYLKEAGFSEQQLLGFHREIESAFETIRRNPMTWSHAPGSKRARKVQVLRFRLQVFYSIRSDGQPYVLEVAGPGRRPRWRGRL